MEVVSARKPRRVCATASYLNAGLWGSRFVGECELATNGERVWLKGRRVPVWMTLARVFGYLAFLPVGLYTGFLLGETLLGHWGYPPYYYLASALLTFLLVVLGLWGAGIWNKEVSSYESVVWQVPRGSIINAAERLQRQAQGLLGLHEHLRPFRRRHPDRGALSDPAASRGVSSSRARASTPPP